MTTRALTALFMRSTLRQARASFRVSGETLLGMVMTGLAGLLLISFLVQETIAYLFMAREVAPSAALSLMYLIMTVAIGLLAVPALLSGFFFSGDYSLLSPLPLRSRDIVSAKLLATYLLFLAPSALICVPAHIVFFIVGQGGWSGLGSGLLVSVVYPLIPLGAVGILTSLAVQVDAVVRRRGAMLLLANGLVVAAAVGVALAMESTVYSVFANVDSITTRRLFEDTAHAVHRVTNAFAPIRWATEAASGALGVAGVVAIARLFAVAMAVVALFVTSAHVAYRTACPRILVSAEPIGRVRSIDAGGLRAKLVAREWWILNQQRFFVIEAFAELFVAPLLILVFGVVSALSRRSVTPLDRMLSMVRDFPYLDLVAAAGIVLISTMNTVSATAISREGSCFYISKVLPIPFRSQYQAKVIFNSSFALSTAVISFLGMSFAGLHLQSPVLFLAVVVTVILLIETSVLGFDLLRPTLSWTNPAQAMNSNPSVVLSMLAILVLMAALAGISLAGIQLGVGTDYILAALIVLALLGTIWQLRVMSSLAERLYPRIEPT